MSNVTALPGSKVPTNEPNPALVQALENLLEHAKDGRLQSFIGTGFTVPHSRLTIWFDTHENVYEMRGSLAWLESEYVHRHTSEYEIP